MSEGARRILESLREVTDGTCSGEGLSSQLGVSRAQVWKHVSALRKRGYTIEGAPGGGYRLISAPDKLYADEITRGLTSQWLGQRIEHFDETDSTNRVAAGLAREGAAHGTAVIAESQTAGRGRLGRSFFSPPQSNLYTSIVLRPSLDTASAPTLLLAAGIAVAETVMEELGEEAADLEIKWPNDVLLGGLKTSGVLMELEAEENRVSHAILGIGVNLNVGRDEFPEEFRNRATSLRAHSGRLIDRVAFTRRLFEKLENILDEHEKGGLDRLRPRFDAHFHMLGRRITVAEINGQSVEGIAAGVAPNGALLLDRPSGERLELLAGDVTICKDPPSKE
ncbi:MAG: biotin--[acetyl-CoA-carboxylase] ligase [Myxococcota bacterium]|jgi:BirA family transcriptional regulator, biotin operon repressor / biotin---[acetyl-CoA-carboxylase] ligase|nr:biotin--[acetyl-CoA-carboxylase] ligase [Myxococcota bacterium]